MTSLSPGSRVWLLLAVVLGLGIRLHGLGESELWLDEVHSLADSAGGRAGLEKVRFNTLVQSTATAACLGPGSSVLGVFRGMRVDTHPPVYFEVLLLARRLVGDDRALLRLPSVLASLVTLLLAGAILRELGEKEAGTWCAFVLALAFVPIQMAQDARPYSLAGMFAALSTLALVRLARTGAARRVLPWALLYGLSLYLAVMTHYFAALALVGPLACLPWLGARRRPALLAALGAALLFLLTWSSSLAAQRGAILSQGWLLDTAPGAWQRAVARLLASPVTLLFQREATLPVVLIGALAWAGLAAWLWRSASLALRLSAVTMLVPILALGAVDVATGQQLLLYGRYPSIAALGLASLVALAVVRLLPRWRVAALACLGAAVVLTLSLPTRKPTWGGQLDPGELGFLGAGDVVLLAGGPSQGWIRTVFPVLAYRIDQANSARPCAEPAPVLYVLLTQRPGPELLDQLSRFSRLFVVAPVPGGGQNPLPAVFAAPVAEGYLRDVGYVSVFERQPS